MEVNFIMLNKESLKNEKNPFSSSLLCQYIHTLRAKAFAKYPAYGHFIYMKQAKYHLDSAIIRPWLGLDLAVKRFLNCWRSILHHTNYAFHAFFCICSCWFTKLMHILVWILIVDVSYSVHVVAAATAASGCTSFL